MNTPQLPVPLVHNRRFQRFWLARIVATAANQMLMVAIGWQMYDLTSSAWDLGLIGLYQFAPALALALPAGYVIDRYDRRLILAGCMLLQCLLAGALAMATHGDWVNRELLLGISLLLGTARAFQMPSTQALLPSLVAPVQLPRALAISSAAMQAAIVGGPAIGGFVYAAGAVAAYGLCSVLFVAGLGLFAAIGRIDVQRFTEPASLATLLAGARFIRSNKAVLGAISLDLFAVLLGGATALLPMFAKEVLHVGPQGLGLLRAAPAIGALLTSAWLALRPLDRRVGRVMFAAVAVYGLSMLAFALATGFVLAFVALLVSGAADMVSVVVRQALVQLDTPDVMRGRVSAVNSIFIGASNQLGEFESGVTAALLGPVGSVLAGGLGTLLVAALWIRWFPQLWTRDRLVR